MEERPVVVDHVDIVEILKRIPHRYPFVLVDRLLAFVPMKSASAIKNVSVNDQFFDGSDRRDLRMPQMLIVEAMAQTSALLCSLSFAHRADLIYIFAGIDHCRFGRSVVPGDQLSLKVSAVRMARKCGKYHARALVGREMAAEADLVAVVA
jgi:3-hydroxyacyl-[acyl-carrier-protein] dehydratase